MYADTTCPAGWTRASDMDGRFLIGSSTFGTTGGSSSHSHQNFSCSSTSISTTNIPASTSSGTSSTSNTHTHNNLAATMNPSSLTLLPPYRNMILCYRNRFTIDAGLISPFSNAVPSGWTRFSALDNYLPQANSSYGGIGGASSHTHTYVATGTISGPSATVNTITTPRDGTGGTISYAGGYKIHKFTGNGTFTINLSGTVDALIVAGGGGGGGRGGGGGGAGGLLYISPSISAGSHSVVVGGGGGGGTELRDATGAGKKGGNSSVFNTTATGGGGGGSGWGGGTEFPATSGGSGGGSGGGGRGGYLAYGASGTSGQGNSGGNGINNPYCGGGGGGRAASGGNASASNIGGAGGAGIANSITGSSVYYAGGGAGGSFSGSAGSGGAGGGGNSNNAGTNGLGGGGGGSLGAGAGAKGGSGVVIIRYPNPPALSGTGASATHTHTLSNINISTSSNLPPYTTTIFAKADSSIYVNDSNILPSSQLPPLGWRRVTELDNRFTMGSTSYGSQGGVSTHTHTATLTTGGPSGTINLYGSGGYFADSTHTHSCSTTLSSASNIPPYYSVIYIQRKTSVSTTLSAEQQNFTTPSAPLNLVATYGDTQVSLGWNKPSDDGGGVTDYIIQYSNDGGSTWSTFDDGTSTNTYTTVTGLTNGNLYTFRVAASNPAGTSTYSNTVQSTPQALAITSISPTSGTYLGGSSMTINTTGLGDIRKFTQISSGDNHTCAISIDGNSYCWGGNAYGQLGNGNTTSSNVPVLVSQGERPDGVTFTSISTGTSHSCGIGSDGNGYCWGINNMGQLGNGNTGTNSNVPVLVSQGARPSNVTFTSISAGNAHSCGVGSNSEGYCWGWNSAGQLGNGNTGTSSNIPVLVNQGARPGGVTFSSISASRSYSCGLGSNGQGYCWGYNEFGQLGNGNTGTNSNTPVLVSQGARPADVTFKSIDTGYSHACAVGSNNQGYCWGNGGSGELGDGYATGSNTPVLVSQGARPGGVTFSSISAGHSYSCGLGSNGQSYCWGYNGYGQLGDGTTETRITPVLVNQGARPADVTFSSISTEIFHICGIGSDGNGYCWGSNSSGQLGNKSTTNSNVAVLVNTDYQYRITVGNNVLTQDIPGGSTSITVSPIPAHAVGAASVGLTRVIDNVSSNSTSYTYTNLATPDITSITPSTISSNTSDTFSIAGTGFLDYGPMNNLTNFSSGYQTTCGVDSNGNGYCWGHNTYGQLGNGEIQPSSNIPVLVSQGERPSNVTFTSISTGFEYSCGIGSDGQAYCWGRNNYGQLGNGNTGTDSSTPVLVSQGARPSNVTYTKISTGNAWDKAHVCALGNDGNIYCWGKNNLGQLGNGYTTDSNIPVLVSKPGGVTFSSISAGNDHTCSLSTDGNGYCWGYNNNGQLGDGTDTQRATPVLVSQGARPSADVTFNTISAGSGYTCGVGSDGNGYCWGANYIGQLGNSSTGSPSTTPSLVNQGARPTGVTFTGITAVNQHTCGIGSDNNVYCWGWNYYGQLGDGTNIDSGVPVLVNRGAIPTGETLSNVTVGGAFSCVKRSSGFVMCWGQGTSGRLGNMELMDRPTPSYVIKKKSPTIEFGTTSATSTTYTSTTAMSAVSPVLSTPGTLAVKLTNPDGQYDTYNIFVGNIPSAPLNLVATYGDAQVSLGWTKPSDEGGGITDYIIQYSSDGGSTWNTFDDGTSTNTFTTVTGLTNGTQYTFRVAAVNPVGTSSYSNTTSSTPQALTITSISPTSGTYLGGGTMTINATGLGDSHKFTQVSPGDSHTCAIGYDGNGYCWGGNSYGQLGDGTNINRDTLVLVSKGAMGSNVTFSSISAGSYHTCGVGSDGNGYCWGYNQDGQLGNGNTGTNSNVPVLVSQGARSADVTFISINTGQQHTCGVGSDGNGYCWGLNNYGQLGKGTSGSSSNIPVLVSQGARPSADITFISISAGNNYTCGVGSNGQGYCWGYNNYGQLGNGTNGSGTNSNVPVLVSQERDLQQMLPLLVSV